MREVNLKKDSDGILKWIAVFMLGGAAFLVLSVAGLFGWLFWRMQSPAKSSAPVFTGAPIPPAVQPIREPDEETQPLPPLRQLRETPLPSLPRKRIAFILERTFAGHDGPVLSIALSSDRRRLVSGGKDRTVRLWDCVNGKELARLEGHTGPVRGVDFAPDGERIVSASEDGSVRLWDVASKTLIRAFVGHEGAVHCVRFTPDGKRLLSGGADRSLRVWDVESGRQLHEWYGHDAALTCLSISADGTRVLTGSCDGGALCRDVATGRELCYLHVGGQVHFALFTADGKRAVVGGDRPARLCDLESGEQGMAETGVGTPLRGAALLGDGTSVLHGGDGKRLEARQLTMRQRDQRQPPDVRRNQLGQSEAQSGAITCVCASGDGRLALAAGEDGVIKLWKLQEQAGDEGRIQQEPRGKD